MSNSNNKRAYINNKGSATAQNRKKKKSVKKIVITLVAIMLVSLIAMGFVIWKYLFGGLTQTEITKDFSELGIDSSRAEQTQDTGVVNIALYGIDSRTNTNKGLSDAIMIATVDKKNGDIKLTSIARDSYVSIEGHGKTKITEAYSYGGSVLAIKTLNQNFDMDIKDYVTVNFYQLANVIDSAGGVTINITEAERVMLNGIMDEVTPKAKKVAKAGDALLMGNQAVAYCRIRYIGTDDARTQRQRNVLQALFSKAKGLNAVDLAKVIHETMPMVETSLSYEKILDMAKILTNKDVEMKEMAIPNSQIKVATGNVALINGKWFYIYDLDVAKKQIYDFIYNDIRVE